MERKNRLAAYILMTILCLAIALGASAGYAALERLNRRYIPWSCILRRCGWRCRPSLA